MLRLGQIYVWMGTPPSLIHFQASPGQLYISCLVCVDPHEHGLISVLVKSCSSLRLENRVSKAPPASACMSIFSDNQKQIEVESLDKAPKSLLREVHRAEEPSFIQHTKKQTKAIMEVLQIFKWDLIVQRPYASLLREDTTKRSYWW